jgi:hypothetical protein
MREPTLRPLVFPEGAILEAAVELGVDTYPPSYLWMLPEFHRPLFAIDFPLL